jgi:hypothetical protein
MEVPPFAVVGNYKVTAHLSRHILDIFRRLSQPDLLALFKNTRFETVQVTPCSAPNLEQVD